MTQTGTSVVKKSPWDQGTFCKLVALHNGSCGTGTMREEAKLNKSSHA